MQKRQSSAKRDNTIIAPASDVPLGELALFILDQSRRHGGDGCCFVCADESRADRLGAVIHAFDPSSGVMVLPSLIASPDDDLEPSRETAGRRSSVLRRLADDRYGLLITTPDALLRRVPSTHAMSASAMRLRVGDAFDEATIRAALIDGGYLVGDPVDMPGMATFLGQVFEIFPAGALAPVRVSHEDGTIAEIHIYGIADGRKVGELNEATIDVVNECDDGDVRRPCSTTIFNYLPRACWILDHRTLNRADSLFRKTGRHNDDSTSAPALLTRSEWQANIGGDNTTILPKPAGQPGNSFYSAFSPGRALRKFLADQSSERRRVIFTAATKADLKAMDRRAGSASVLCANWKEADGASLDERSAILADLDRGFISREGTVVVTATDVLGSRASHQDIMRVAGRRGFREAPLSLGDVVVHMDRGLAVLRELVIVSATSAAEAEMVKLEFVNEEAVLVSLSELRLIWRYGADAEGVRLDKADGSTWTERRGRVEVDIGETAAHIRQRIAQRHNDEAPKLVPQSAQYEAFATGFGYVPTIDQGNAISDVLSDLASGHAMDRLVCGDVGYGKTEVALRAAAAAAFAGKQIAIVVPTTVLAQQHLKTFRDRFAPFDIEVGELSRFTPACDARAVKKALADGSLSIVIGTHSLSGKGVRFADLGLVVIDEEQHFGRLQKEKLARMSRGIHLLTMSATPIPRTLSEARMGLRSLSLISTPPVRRSPVGTIVEPFHDATVASALRREKRRRGQSFVVCPRIDDIEPMAERLRDIVPELKITAIHGKMRAVDIDSAMLSFTAGAADVLLATNIIESGLDFPRANTIVVWRPEKFGLGQLHQLRGRVGRRSTRAFALLLSEPDSSLTGAAKKRLATLRDHQEQNSGFLISAHDLDIRGGGDILSEQQSGHIKVLGLELSEHLLDRALRNERPELDQPRADLNLDTPLLLPATFIPDPQIRIGLYARLFRCNTETDLDNLEDEIHERFGDLPNPAQNLIDAARLQLESARLRIVKIDIGEKSAAATFGEGTVEFDVSDQPNLAWNDGRLIYDYRDPANSRLGTLRTLLSLIAQRSSPAGDQATAKQKS